MAGAAQITEQDLRDHIASSGPELRRQYPKIYGFLGGLAGTAPDEFEGSVLDPTSQAVKEGASYGFPIGVGVAVAPFAKGIMAAKGVAAGGKTAQKGVLRLGGRKDLIASHGTSAASLVDEHGRLIPELTNLSLAIERNRLANPWGDTKLILQPNKLDPRNSPSIIHTQDAFTPPSFLSSVHNMLDTNPQAGVNELAKARMYDRFVTDFPKGGANAAELDGMEVLGNRRFNSYKAYEQSPYGADLPRPRLSKDEDWQLTRFKQALELQDPGDVLGMLERVMKAPNREFAGLDKYKMYRLLRQQPQEYAELKSFGQTPINSDTFAGAIITRPKNATNAQLQAIRRLEDALADKGITSRYSSNAPGVDFDTATQLQKNAK